MRGVSQRLVPSDGSGTPEGMESHLPQGLWCLTFEDPVDTGLSAEEQVGAICARARWHWANHSFASLCGLDTEEALERYTLSTVFPIEHVPNRNCFHRFVESGHRLIGGECYTQGPDGQLRVGRVRMTGQVIEGRLHRIYGCYEDLTHLLADPP
jgi:PAS domain-containing protein